MNRKCKKGSISKPNRPADGTRFSEVVFFTWSQRFFNFSKVKNGVSEPWRIPAQIGLRGAKSPKKGAWPAAVAGRRGRPPWPPPWPAPWPAAVAGRRGRRRGRRRHAHSGHRRHAHDGHRRHAHSFHHGLSRNLHQRDLVAQARDVRLRLLTRPPC